MKPYVAAAGWTLAREEGSNADAFELHRTVDGNRCRLDAAVADGASTTLFADRWATELATSAVNGWPTLDDEALLAALEVVREHFEPLADPTNRFIARKWSQRGSQATLAAVTLVASHHGIALRAVSVGDSEVVVIRRDRCEFFPIEHSSVFNSVPELITSQASASFELRRLSRPIESGDIVLLATDAVAKRILQLYEAHGRQGIIHALQRLVHEGAGLEPALALDGHGTLDDDMTLVICTASTTGVGDDLTILGEALRPPPQTAGGFVRRLRRWLRREL